jgi:2-keto-3-deoxy-6-phosphogluconate aldolase
MAAFFAAGAVGVGMGSQLFPKAMLQAQEWEALGQHFRRAAQTYRNIQSA